MTRVRWPCLVTIGWAVLCGAAAAAADGPLPCAASERSLLGSWQHVGTFTAFEEMEFAVEDGRRVFNSWLHERPEIRGGTWSLQGCALRVADATAPELSFDFVIAASPPGRLVLRDRGTSDASRYRRLKDVP